MSSRQFVRWTRIASLCLMAAAGAGLAHGQGAPKLLAPVYPGAVALRTDAGKALPCVDSRDWKIKVWCYGTNDAPEKVKAFYDQKVGALEPIPAAKTSVLRNDGKYRASGESGTWLRLQYIDTGEADEDHFGGVMVVTRSALPVPKGNPDELRQVASESPHFMNLANAVNWGGGAGIPNLPPEVLAQMKASDSSGHQPPELESLMEQHGAVTTYYFPATLKDKKFYFADAKLRDEMLAKASKAALDSQTRMTSGSQDAMRKNQAAGRSGSPDSSDQELEALFKKKPALGNAYAAKAMEANQAIQKGDYRAAAKAGKEGEAIVRADPEGAEIMKRRDQQEAQRKAQSEQRGAAQQAEQKRSFEAMRKAQDYPRWGVWVDYLAAADKAPHYRTLIRIEEESKAGVRDRAKVDKAWANWMARHGKDVPEATAQAVKPAAPAANAPAKAAPPPENKDSGDDAAETAKKAGQEGLKMLKKLF